MAGISQARMQELLAKARALKAQETQQKPVEILLPAGTAVPLSPEQESAATTIWSEAEQARMLGEDRATVTATAETKVQRMLREARERVAARKDTGVGQHGTNSLGISLPSSGSTTASSTLASAVASTLDSSEGRIELESPAAGGPRVYLTAAGKEVTLNARQLEYIENIVAGKDVVLIGKAGTGKTTVAGVGMTELIRLGRVTPLTSGTDHLCAGLPGIAVLSFTNKAVNNIRRQMPADLKPHCLTIHKILEFKPVYYEITAENGETRTTMRFEPARGAFNPLPEALKLVVFEESSMISIDLHQLLLEAIQHPCQFAYLGDIRQLPPVFGSAILGFKMLEIPVVELDEVYRQALLSPILRAALTVDDGKVDKFNGDSRVKDAKGKWSWPVLAKWNESGEHGSLTIKPWQKELSPDIGLMSAVKIMTSMADAGDNFYNPEQDMILCPHNVGFGTIELNKGIAQHLGVKRNAVVHEVIAGFQKHYLAVGDRVLCNKNDAFITAIAFNGDYMGALPQPSSEKLNRWGHYQESLSEEEKKMAEEVASDFELNAIENFLESSAAEIESRVTAASHVVTVRYADSSDGDTFQDFDLESAAEINDMLGGYAITVHKAQGSEYDRVFLFFHESHAAMLSRELLYTAMTRAAKHLTIICHPTAIQKAIKNQRIKGNTLEEKAEFFKGKIDQYRSLVVTDAAEVSRIAGIKEKVKQAVLDSINKLSAAYPNKPAVSITDVTFIDTGSAAGTASLKEGRVNINPLYIKWDLESILADTVPHEVAHVFAYFWFDDCGHGTAWKQLCLEAGGTGGMYHDMGAAKKLRQLPGKK